MITKDLHQISCESFVIMDSAQAGRTDTVTVHPSTWNTDDSGIRFNAVSTARGSRSPALEGRCRNGHAWGRIRRRFRPARPRLTWEGDVVVDGFEPVPHLQMGDVAA